MSRMIPQRTVDTMRHSVNVSVGLFGIPCTLYIPSNLDTVINYDVYKKPSDFTYDQYSTEVWIEWSQDKHRLRRLGLYLEDRLPVVAWFKYLEGAQELEIPVDSWFTIDTQYVPDKVDTEEFEIVDVLVPGMHEKVITKYYEIAPRRLRK